ncbi:hypothetical protein BGZ61DRAFT_448825 [Ilyonectria robusta]|uniref:uncharacterized protein n=1 Tax=Ilyonectria robusta TaxID=1079257 RepID=UPI001E8ECC20|nr:uncharacterized protein BGZ61DRAFT_448825 [Ilyonectria robusta]KAH8714316.1 hypothetical protein BGZ61DRAFT_448825 [Ilyonectria robusta]
MGHGGGWGRGMVGVVAGLVAGVGSGRSSGRSSGRGIWYWPWWAWTWDGRDGDGAGTTYLWTLLLSPLCGLSPESEVCALCSASASVSASWCQLGGGLRLLVVWLRVVASAPSPPNALTDVDPSNVQQSAAGPLRGVRWRLRDVRWR